MRSLLDINVLIALLDQDHAFHARAHACPLLPRHQVEEDEAKAWFYSFNLEAKWRINPPTELRTSNACRSL